MLTFAVEHFARHQYREFVAFLQLTEIHLPLHGLDHRVDFRAGQPGITRAGDKAGADGALQHAVDPIAFLQLAAHFKTVIHTGIGAGLAAGHLPGQALQIAVGGQGPGELLANLQVAQLFIGGGKLGDIAHIDTVLVQNTAERIAGRHHIFVPAGIAIGFFVELILRNGFFFLRGLIDRLGGFRQQGADLAFFQFNGSDDGGGFRVVNVGSPDGDR